MISANEIALEAKIQTLEAQLKELKTFESDISMAVAQMLMGAMLRDEGMSLKSFDKIKDLIEERAMKNIKNSEKYRRV